MVYFDEDPQEDLKKAVEYLAEQAPRPLALSQRKKIAKTCPWITYFDQPHKCGAWTNSGQTCKHKAHWRYRYMKFLGYKRPPEYLCWKHLMYDGIYSNMSEDERFSKWLNKRYPKLKDIP